MTQSQEGVKLVFEELSGHPGRECKQTNKQKNHLKDETVILLTGWADEMMGNSLDQ